MIGLRQKILIFVSFAKLLRGDIHKTLCVDFDEEHSTVRDPVRENLNFKGFEKKKHGHLPDFFTGDPNRL